MVLLGRFSESGQMPGAFYSCLEVTIHLIGGVFPSRIVVVVVIYYY